MRIHLTVLAVLGLLAPGSPGFAQKASTDVAFLSGRPVRLIVPFPAGGSIDLMSRLLAEALQSRLGRPVVVENRAGAGGNVGAEALARAAPDGDTLGALPANLFTINRYVYRRLPFDPDADFTL